jgi:hypothetical protein
MYYTNGDRRRKGKNNSLILRRYRSSFLEVAAGLSIEYKDLGNLREKLGGIHKQLR